MKIVRIGKPQVIMRNPGSRHNYFAWPTAARLQNGKIAVVASGFRLRHICPFGKTVIAYSEDEGCTYTAPAPIIDTVLDDRDGGIATFGEQGVVITSFNNRLDFQRRYGMTESAGSYDEAYLDMITPEEEKAALGASFRFSHDCGTTFGQIYKSPVTSPHGPVALPDGGLLWVGRIFDRKGTGKDCIQAYRMELDGKMEYLGEIENVTIEGAQHLSSEPHAIVLEDGTILVHIRVQGKPPRSFTIFQTRSRDGGKTWTKPEQILPLLGGSPPHLMRHSSGLLICSYACREAPFTVKAMFSRDAGKTWDTGHEIYVNGVENDMGYPTTVELLDGSMLTVFYAHMEKDGPAVVAQQKWRFALEEL